MLIKKQPTNNPLHKACNDGNIEEVKKLSKEYSINDRNMIGYTPADIAYCLDDKKLYKAITKLGGKLSFFDIHGTVMTEVITSAIGANVIDKLPQIEKFIEFHNLNPLEYIIHDKFRDCDFNLLYIAIKARNVECVKLLLKYIDADQLKTQVISDADEDKPDKERKCEYDFLVMVCDLTKAYDIKDVLIKTFA